MLEKYKWAFGIGILLLYSFGVWHVASRYQEAKFLEEKLIMATEVIEKTAEFNSLNDQISAAIQEELSKLKQKNTVINREIQREIDKNPVYIDCRNTDGVVQQYEQKLDSQ